MLSCFQEFLSLSSQGFLIVRSQHSSVSIIRPLAIGFVGQKKKGGEKPIRYQPQRAEALQATRKAWTQAAGEARAITVKACRCACARGRSPTIKKDAIRLLKLAVSTGGYIDQPSVSRLLSATTHCEPVCIACVLLEEVGLHAERVA